MATLSLADSFASFDANKVRRHAEFYSNEIKGYDLLRLKLQFGNYIDDMRQDDMFKGLNIIIGLFVKLVETKRDDREYHWIYMLLKLVLLLLVTTTSVERVFSATTFVKNKLINEMAIVF